MSAQPKKMYVFMNPEGNLGLGVKVDFHDNWDREDKEIVRTEGYKIAFRPEGHDGWLVQSHDTEPFIFVPSNMIEKKVEIIDVIEMDVKDEKEKEIKKD